MIEDIILKQRQMVQQRINKAFGVEIEKSENELDIEKARSGVYADNAENRRLNRVGQRYGSSKKQESGGENVRRKLSDEEIESMSDKDLIKRYKIPDANAKYSFVRSGSHNPRYDRTLRSHDGSGFLDLFRVNLKKYGNPIKVEKVEVHERDRDKFWNAINNRRSYSWFDGEKVYATFKDNEGNYIVIDSTMKRHVVDKNGNKKEVKAYGEDDPKTIWNGSNDFKFRKQ